MNASLADWLVKIDATHFQEIDLGLDRVSRVLQRLDCAHDFNIITVGGTNGKGSTCAMLESIYSASRYKVGLFSSPHLLRFNERIRVDKQEVRDAEIIDAFEEIESARKEITLTYFEFSFLAAYLIFHRADVDVAILEVGLGGRLDAVNVLDPTCAVVTNVALDHTDYLGDTREEIAREKADIFRGHGSFSVCGDEDPPSSLLEVVEEKGSDLHLLFRDFGYSENPTGWAFWNLDGCRLNLPSLPMVGTHQLANASVAVEVVQLLRSRLPVDNGAMRAGLVSCRSIGRIQILPLKPMIILDVAHNIASVRELVAYLNQTSFPGKTHVIFGVLSNKNYKEMVALLDGVSDRWMFCTLKSSRGLGPDISLSALREYNHEKEARMCESVSDALDSALKSSDANDRIIVCGSFVTVSEALAHPLLSDTANVS